jgi:SAM-dependent methyltransferase
MRYDSQFWAAAWREARQTSSLGKGYPNVTAWTDFWNLAAEGYARRNRQALEFNDSLIAMLAREGVVQPHSIVLDVGCGPGTYTIPLARRAARVVGLDSAPRMLEVMRREAEFYQVAERVEARPGAWDEIPAMPDFDLVLAAKSPAIYDYDSLVKMNQVGREHACIITFVGVYKLSLRNALWQIVTGAPLQGAAFDLSYPFNILYSAGYLPNLRFYAYRGGFTESVAYWMAYFRCYFRIFGYEGPETDARIAHYLNSVAEDGRCEDREDYTLAVMWWRTGAG